MPGDNKTQLKVGRYCDRKSPLNGNLLLLVSNGAQGRNRTTDTAIFSRMLYQLSYLGVLQERGQSPSSGRFIVGRELPVHPRFAVDPVPRGPVVHKPGQA